MTVACEGGARFTGVSDSLKAVSGKSTGGTADPPKTPAKRNTINIRERRFTATLPQVLESYSRRQRMSNRSSQGAWKQFCGRSVDTGYETGIHAC